MIKKVLTNLVYLFYPKNICWRTEEKRYIDSNEYKRLLETIGCFYKFEDINNHLDLKEEFDKDYILKNFRNASLLSWQDRAVTFDLSIVEKDEMYTLTLYLSVLIPFYVVRVKKNNIKLFFSENEISGMRKDNLIIKKINELICDVSSIVEEKMFYKKFPEELLSTIIEDVSFQEIGFGNFNLFNAFFNNSTIDENNNFTI